MTADLFAGLTRPGVKDFESCFRINTDRHFSSVRNVRDVTQPDSCCADIVEVLTARCVEQNSPKPFNYRLVTSGL